MIENPLNDLGADPLFLVSLVDDHVPDGRTRHEISQDTSESHQLVPIPRTDRHIGMTQHLFGILKRAVFGPGRLMEEPKQLGCFEDFLFGKSYCGLEGWRHLVLDYLPITASMTGGVYEENDVNASP